uniref:Uncharacterized protein n=1 Tax=Lutzomyia longipalpis TaxID=7200 RepID=A0A1B0CBV3_LUTLO
MSKNGNNNLLNSHNLTKQPPKAPTLNKGFKCKRLVAGTSTRKPRLNSALVAQQAATLPGASSGVGLPNGTGPKPPPGSTSAKMSSRNKHKHTKKFARLKNVDRSSAQTREVTVNSVTVVITEYKPK